MKRISDVDVLKHWEKIPSHIRSMIEYWDYPRFIKEGRLFAYEKAKSMGVIIAPKRQKSADCSEQIAATYFKALNTIQHKRFLVPTTSTIVILDTGGFDATHNGAVLYLSIKLWEELDKAMLQKQRRVAAKIRDYIATQIAHELTHKVQDADDTEDAFDNYMYGNDIYCEGICRFTEYITASLFFSHGFCRQLEDVQRYLEGKKQGYNNPDEEVYFVGLYMCLIIFLEWCRKIPLFSLDTFHDLSFEQQMSALRDFRNRIRKSGLKKEFLEEGKKVRVELLKLREYDAFNARFRTAEKSLGVKKKLPNR